MRKAALATLVAFGSVPIAHADGTVGFEQADEFLKQAPDVRAYLMETLCIASAGWAARLASNYPLGGARIGPYKFQARPKGQPNGPRFELRITTHQIGYDANGKEIIGRYGEFYPIELAYSIKETFAAAELRVPQEWTLGLTAVNCDEPL
jgi:hypothetical protein